MPKTKRIIKEFPVNKEMCATCPWREGSPYAYLRRELSESSRKTSRICHCTGDSIIHPKSGKPERVCRGSRNEQLAMFFGAGFLEAPTDEAWTKMVKEINDAGRLQRVD